MQVKEILDEYGRTPDKLIGAMLAYQKATSCNYLTKEDIKEFSVETGIPISRVYSIATFYSLLSTKIRGKHIIQVCYDVPCYINESVNVVKELEKYLGIEMGQTTTDGLFL